MLWLTRDYGPDSGIDTEGGGGGGEGGKSPRPS